MARTPAHKRHSVVMLRRSKKRSRRKPAARKNQPKPSIFSPIMSGFRLLVLGVFSVFLLAISAYFFVLPVVFQLEEPLNLVIVSSDLEQSEAVLFVHISPKTQKSIVAVLDGTDKVAVLGGYGEYSIQSLYSLLQLERKDEQYVRAAFSHALGVLVDTVVPVESLTFEQAEQLELVQVFEHVLRDPHSELSLEQKLRLYFSARSFRSNERHPETATDIAEEFGAHPLIQERTAKACQVAVVNTTGTFGMAGGVARLLEQSGAFVVRVANESDQYPETVMYVQEGVECTSVVERATKLFPKVPQLQTDLEIPVRYRADLVIMAGSDLSEALEVAE